MKKIILFVTIFTSIAFTVSGGEPPHSKSKKLKVSSALRQNMTLMEGQYINLQILTKSNGMDYDQILKALEKMEGHAQKIRQINGKSDANEILDQPLVDLDSQIAGLKKYIVSRNPIRLRKGIDRLYSSCFRCHEAHAPAGE